MKTHAFVIAAVLAVAPSIASAGEPSEPEVIPPKARALAVQGRAFHDSGDYGNAIIAFKEAYVMAPSAGLLFNLAQAYRLAGNCDDAALMYRRYIATGPSEEGRTIAEGHLETVERCTHKTALGIPQDVGAPMFKTDRASGSLFATAPRQEGHARLEKTLGIGFVIGGGVALGIATYYGFEARSSAAEVEKGYAMGAKWKDLADIDARGQRASMYAKAFGIGGGLGVAGGVALYLLGRRSEQVAPIAIAPTKQGATVSASWQF